MLRFHKLMASFVIPFIVFSIIANVQGAEKECEELYLNFWKNTASNTQWALPGLKFLRNSFCLLQRAIPITGNNARTCEGKAASMPVSFDNFADTFDIIGIECCDGEFYGLGPQGPTKLVKNGASLLIPHCNLFASNVMSANNMGSDLIRDQLNWSNKAVSANTFSSDPIRELSNWPNKAVRANNFGLDFGNTLTLPQKMVGSTNTLGSDLVGELLNGQNKAVRANNFGWDLGNTLTLPQKLLSTNTLGSDFGNTLTTVPQKMVGSANTFSTDLIGELLNWQNKAMSTNNFGSDFGNTLTLPQKIIPANTLGGFDLNTPLNLPRRVISSIFSNLI